MNPEIVTLIEAVIQALGPIVAKIVEAALAGHDPLAPLASENPADIIPVPLKLQLAEAAAKAHVASKAAAVSHVAPGAVAAAKTP
jgi:hypothetical protein